ncbi:MAG: hypothetical protein CSA26_02140, partial [Desulfobacterales bacterium]
MNTFLKELTQFDSIQDVILLSEKGEPLFSGLPIVNNISRTRMRLWFEVINELNRPTSSEFLFENGRYLVKKTAIGYLIVGMSDDANLETIKNASNTIVKQLNDPKFLKKALLWMLTVSDDSIKSYLIKTLAPMADAEVAASLVLLLEKEQEFKPQAREQLQLLICEALGYCGTYEAIAPLQKFFSRHTQAPKTALHEEISEAITISIKQLKQETKPRPSTASPAAPKTSETQEQPSPQETAKQQKKPELPASLSDVPETTHISELLEKGETNQAITTITQLIEEKAGQKLFKTAESLRNWLIEIAPMALTDIVQAAEVIEKAKRAAIDTYHLDIWRDLVTLLSAEEFSTLYHAMELYSYPNGEMIVEQGSTRAMLLFINSGKIQTQISYNKEVLPLSIKTAGEIAGAETMFSASVWTISIKSLGTELFILSRQALNEVVAEHPSLNAKLLHFCSQLQSTSSQLKKFRKDRRRHERKKITNRISFVVLSSEDKAISPNAKGYLIDISLGGIAFSIHASQKKNAMWFFGKKLHINIDTASVK